MAPFFDDTRTHGKMCEKAVLLLKKLKDKNPTENIIYIYKAFKREREKSNQRKMSYFFTDDRNTEC